jgi:hypothetical protein
MTKWTSMLSGVAVATLLLTGCGTSNTDEVKKSPKENTSTNQNGTSQNEDPNASVPTSTSEAASAEQKSGIQEKEQQLQYVFQDESKEETAFLKNSDNQPYSLYVLPNFELSAEEPGKDVILFSENDKIFMRIELLPDNTDWAAIEENVKAQLSSISASIYDPGLNIENGSSYEVTKDNEVVTAILLKNEKAPVRLTLFTTKDADYRDAFLQMAKTIQKQ